MYFDQNRMINQPMHFWRTHCKIYYMSIHCVVYIISHVALLNKTVLPVKTKFRKPTPIYLVFEQNMQK
ncbi:Uncharacterised protein [Escherichia coli]|nr:Uncharacterised protein [Escherichia coli]SQQ67659.1 Uncharacterised protein [Escherichia coli]